MKWSFGTSGRTVRKIQEAVLKSNDNTAVTYNKAQLDTSQLVGITVGSILSALVPN